tara:strand:- start:4731 stop:5723 length:993 start_codon:yes stop_codon:yes gene_type:complete
MTKIIAEVGINHNGSIKKLFKLIDIAKYAGADYLKIQTYIPENVIIKNIDFAPYQKINSNKKENFYDLLKKYQISHNDHFIIKKYCDKSKIKFISSPFDVDSAKFLCEKLKLKIIKIPSSEITNYQLLSYLSKFSLKIILSTGMSNINEISEAIKVIKVNKSNLTLLHCNTAYPTPIYDVNMLAMIKMKKIFNCKIGYSDHTLGNHAALVATSLGAELIEKHITLNTNDKGPDHKSSLNKKDFVKFVRLVKETKKILGSEQKKITKSEKVNLKFARKSIYSNRQINKGEIFSKKNLITLRPYRGISAMKIKKIYGKKSKKNYKKFSLIKI